jgi:hypothetical protein
VIYGGRKVILLRYIGKIRKEELRIKNEELRMKKEELRRENEPRRDEEHEGRMKKLLDLHFYL